MRHKSVCLRLWRSTNEDISMSHDNSFIAIRQHNSHADNKRKQLYGQNDNRFFAIIYTWIWAEKKMEKMKNATAPPYL